MQISVMQVMKQISIRGRNRAQFFCPAQASCMLHLPVSPETVARATEVAWRYFQALQPISYSGFSENKLFFFFSLSLFPHSSFLKPLSRSLLKNTLQTLGLMPRLR